MTTLILAKYDCSILHVNLVLQKPVHFINAMYVVCHNGFGIIHYIFHKLGTARTSPSCVLWKNNYATQVPNTVLYFSLNLVLAKRNDSSEVCESATHL
jgi:hypothetical protein